MFPCSARSPGAQHSAWHTRGDQLLGAQAALTVDLQTAPWEVTGLGCGSGAKGECPSGFSAL